MGTWLQAVAGSVFVFQLTGSSFAVGVFNFAGFIPILLFSVWGGRVSDRYDRRHVVVVTHALSCLTSAVLAALTIAGEADQASLIAATFLINVLWAFGKPALQSLIPNIVPREDLRDAVAMSSMGFQLGQVAGPLLAAAAIAASGPGFAFALNALTYVGPIVSMLALYRLGTGGREEGPAARAAASASRLESSGAFVRANPWVLGLLAGIVVISMGMEIQRSLAPAVVADRLHEPDSVVGLVVTAQSVGGLVGFLLFIWIRRAGWSERAALAGLWLQAAGVVALALGADLLVVSAGFWLIGFGFSLCFPVVTAALQEGTPDVLRGRIMAFHQMALLGHRPVTALVLGSVAGLISLQAGLFAWLVVAPIGLLGVRAAWGHRRAAGHARS